MADGAASDGKPDALLLERYRVERILGEGGLGTVYQAFDTRLKRMVALKTLKRSLATDADLYLRLKERFVREAEAGARMGVHPHIATVHDLMTDTDGTHYLVQEFVPGGSVADRLKRGALPVAAALRITADAAEGLDAAHRKGIIHRDIKPANLFLAEDGRALVGDFGIAQVDDVSARTHAAMGHPGTPLYMSPEQQRMTLYLRPASDQYSLGLVLFEMITGAAYRRVGERVAGAMLAEQPPPIAALIARMTAEHPDDRYAAMTDVVWEVRRVERYLAVAETHPTPPTASGDLTLTMMPASIKDTGPIPLAAPPTYGDTVPVTVSDDDMIPVLQALPMHGVAVHGADATHPRPQLALRSFERLASLLDGGSPPPRLLAIAVATAAIGLLLVSAVIGYVRSGNTPTSPTNQPERFAETITPVIQSSLPTPQFATPTPFPSLAIPAAVRTPSAAASPTQDPNVVLVPNLSGSYQPQAADALSKMGLGLGKETQQTSETIPRGQIINQDPRPGDMVKRGSQVNIVTSLGPQQFAPSGTLRLDKSSISLGGGTSGAVTLANPGPAAVSYTTKASTTWLSASPASGSVPSGGSLPVMVTVNRAGLAPGNYSGTVTFTTPSGSVSAVTVTFAVQ